MIDRQSFVDKYFAGDWDAYWQYKKYGIDTTIDWSDISAAASLHPNTQEIALKWIQYGLGYLPRENVYMPHLSFLQVFVHDLERGLISDEKFDEGIQLHLRDIRNDDMKKGGWVHKQDYDASVFEQYETYLPLYRQSAHERLAWLLGRVIPLPLAITAELFLRQLFEMDDYYADIGFTNIDLKAATIALYREAFFNEGKEAADNLPLLGLEHFDKIRHMTQMT